MDITAMSAKTSERSCYESLARKFSTKIYQSQRKYLFNLSKRFKFNSKYILENEQILTKTNLLRRSLVKPHLHHQTRLPIPRQAHHLPTHHPHPAHLKVTPIQAIPINNLIANRNFIKD